MENKYRHTNITLEINKSIINEIDFKVIHYNY